MTQRGHCIFGQLTSTGPALSGRFISRWRPALNESLASAVEKKRGRSH